MCGIVSMTKRRVYISIYFEDAKAHGKKKGDVTLAFSPDDALYNKIKTLGSAEIKRIVGISCYQELWEAAKKEYRSSGNYIKHKLIVYLQHEKENTSS
jgi:hypothetical protein